jgi:hypothetical protein
MIMAFSSPNGRLPGRSTAALGVIQIEYQALWRRGEAGDELLDEGLTDAVNVLPARRVFEARDRRA